MAKPLNRERLGNKFIGLAQSLGFDVERLMENGDGYDAKELRDSVRIIRQVGESLVAKHRRSQGASQ